MQAEIANDVANPSRRRGLARRTLVVLYRRLLSGRWGVRSARFYAGFLAVSTTGTVWILSRRAGPDETTLSLVARSAALLTWIAGGIATVALSAPPKDPAFALGIAALATARGLDAETVSRAEWVATVRLVAEVVVIPIAAIGLFVIAFLAGGRLGAVLPVLGAVAFGAIASIVLGGVASGCRRWGGEQGRSWLFVVVFLPWLVAEVAVGGSAAAYLSIPGVLGRIWEVLTSGAS